MWREVAYGRNATYRNGHHGNAVLSRFPIVAQRERGHLRACVRDAGPAALRGEARPTSAPMLHCLNVHLGLFERGRQWQIRALVERIRATVPRDAPMIIAGDFNDWRRKADRTLTEELGRCRSLRGGQGTPGAHVSVGDADVPARPHLRARARGGRRARALRLSRGDACPTMRRSRPPSRYRASASKSPACVRR